MDNKSLILELDNGFEINYGISSKLGYKNIGKLSRVYSQKIKKVINLSEEEINFYKLFFKNFYKKYPQLKGKIKFLEKKIVDTKNLSFNIVYVNSINRIIKDLYLLKILNELVYTKSKLLNTNNKKYALAKLNSLAGKFTKVIINNGIIQNPSLLKNNGFKTIFEDLERKYLSYYEKLNNKKKVNFNKFSDNLINKLSGITIDNLSSIEDFLVFTKYINSFIELLASILNKSKDEVYAGIVYSKITIFDILTSLYNKKFNNFELITDLVAYFIYVNKIINYFAYITVCINPVSLEYEIIPFDLRADKMKDIFQAIDSLYNLDSFISNFSKKYSLYNKFYTKVSYNLLNLLLNTYEIDFDKVNFLYDLGILKYLENYSEDEQKSILKFIIDNFNFLNSYSSIIGEIDFNYLNYLADIKHKLSNDQFAFLIKNKLYNNDYKYVKILYEFYLKGFNISYLKKLTLSQLEIVLQENLSKEDIYKLSKQDFTDVVLNKKIHTLKNNYLKKLSFFKETGFLHNEYTKFVEQLDNINSSNFEKSRLKLEKEWEKFFDSHFNRIKHIKSTYKVSNQQFVLGFKLFINKSTKKNKLNARVVFNVLEYIFSMYDKDELDFIYDLLSNDKIYITNNFISNYDNIFKELISNRFFVDLDNITKPLSLIELVSLIKEEDIKNILSMKFNQELVPFILDWKNTTLFYKILTIVDILQNGQDEDFYLDLLSLSKDKFKRYYFLIKNFYLVGLNIKSRSEQILNLVKNDFFTEGKLKAFKKLIKTKSISEPEFFYELFFEYVSNNDIDVSIFDVLFEDQEEIETDEIFERNSGIRGLAGWSGKTIVRKFEKLGWKKKKINGKIQGKGDHVLMFKEENGKKRYALIPLHNSVKAKTLFDTLNRSNIKKEDFLNA